MPGLHSVWSSADRGGTGCEESELSPDRLSIPFHRIRTKAARSRRSGILQILFLHFGLLLGWAVLIAVPCRLADSGLAGAALRQQAAENGAVESAGPDCRVERKEFFSEACSSPMAYYAFVPAQNKEGARYPVLYLLHGAFDGYTAWKEHAGNSICRLVSEYGIIIVTPEGLRFGWYADSRLIGRKPD